MAKALFKLLFLSFLIHSFSSCSTLDQSAKYGLSDGTYRYKSQTTGPQRVYIQVEEDSLIIHPLRPGSGGMVDTSRTTILELKERGPEAKKNYLIFTRPSFDIDIATILFKYRPKETYGPRQLNTDFNGVVYLGYRSDRYSIHYKRTPLGDYQRKLNHFGFSAGFFTGLGSTMVAPWFTRDQVQTEYDGLVFVNGIAANVGFNSLTFGVGLGLDHLLDRNRKHWVYQGEPWLGLLLGLNLN